jgi:hypothetical protein
MNSKKVFSLLEIELSKDYLLEDISIILEETPYSDESAFGFSDILTEGNVLEATLTKRSAVSIKTLGEDGDRKDQTIFVFSFVFFVIDFDCNLLEVYGTSKNISKVIQCLNSALGNKISIFPCKTFPSEIIPILKERVEIIEIESLVINYFKYNEYATGKFSPTISSTKTGLALLDEYSKDVVKAILTITSGNKHNYQIEFNSAGRFTIKCNHEHFEEMLILFKMQLNTSKNG